MKNIMKALLPENTELSFLTSPWGRSFQNSGKRSEPKLATSIQFHLRILKADLKTLLRASGNGGVYTVPKSEDRQVVTDYQVVWLQQSKVELAVSLSKCDNHFGIVRAQKGDGKGRGIRFAKRDYLAAYTQLKPDAPTPSLVTPNFFFQSGANASWYDIRTNCSMDQFARLGCASNQSFVKYSLALCSRDKIRGHFRAME